MARAVAWSRAAILGERGMRGRFLALESLEDRTVHALPTDRIHVLADTYGVAARDRALGYEILAGTIKRRGTIDFLIERLGGRRAKSIEPLLLNIVRLGVYQLVFLEHVPAFSAVDLSCKLAQVYRGARQVGFVNAVLRAVQRAMVDKDVAVTEANRAWVVARSLGRAVAFDRRLFDPQGNSTTYLMRAYSYPRWLVKRFVAGLGYDRAREVLAAGNGRAALICRPNPVRLGVSDVVRAGAKLAALLAGEGCQVQMRDRYGAVEMVDGPALTALGAFREGLFQVQDTTSQEVVHRLGVKAGQRILDLCAGLGTKATQIAELTGDGAEVVATDRSDTKLAKLLANAGRLGLESIRTVASAAVEGDRFDVVLADVPCSNTGVLASRPEVRWRVKETDVAMLAGGGLALLVKASRLVKAGGTLGYSTCSIDPQENEQVAARFVSQEAGWALVEQRTTFPQADADTGRGICEGGYWAILRRQ